MKEEFSERLNSVLKDRNISIKELSKKTNISEATLTNWLRSKSFPNRLKPVLALSNYLDLPLSFFWNHLKK